MKDFIVKGFIIANVMLGLLVVLAYSMPRSYDLQRVVESTCTEMCK